MILILLLQILCTLQVMVLLQAYDEFAVTGDATTDATNAAAAEAEESAGGTPASHLTSTIPSFVTPLNPAFPLDYTKNHPCCFLRISLLFCGLYGP